MQIVGGINPCQAFVRGNNLGLQSTGSSQCSHQSTSLCVVQRVLVRVLCIYCLRNAGKSRLTSPRTMVPMVKATSPVVLLCRYAGPESKK